MEAIVVSQRLQRVVEELGPFFLNLAQKYAESNHYTGYHNYEDMKYDAIRFMCAGVFNFNLRIKRTEAHRLSNMPMKYFIQCAAVTYERCIHNERKHTHMAEAIMEEEYVH